MLVATISYNKAFISFAFSKCSIFIFCQIFKEFSYIWQDSLYIYIERERERERERKNEKINAKEKGCKKKCSMPLHKNRYIALKNIKLSTQSPLY